MDFSGTATVGKPWRDIVSLLIDRMEVLVPFLDSVSGIEQLSREDLDDGRIRIVRRWQGDEATVPGFIRRFVNRDLIAWIDDALWQPEEGLVTWSLTTPVGGRLFTCQGTNSLQPDPDAPEAATSMVIQGSLVIHGDRLPGVPSAVGRRVAPKIERFVTGKIAPNLTEVATGLQGYFDAGT